MGTPGKESRIHASELSHLRVREVGVYGPGPMCYWGRAASGDVSSLAFLAWPVCELRQPRGWKNSAQEHVKAEGIQEGRQQHLPRAHFSDGKTEA